MNKKLLTLLVCLPMVASSTLAALKKDFTVSEDYRTVSITMPYYNLNLEYSIVRDMTVGVQVVFPEHILLINNGTSYSVAPSDDVAPLVIDTLGAKPDTLKVGVDYYYIAQVPDPDNAGEWIDYEGDPVPGTYRYLFNGNNAYSGEIYSDPFVLYEGIPIQLEAKSFATYFDTQALTLSPWIDENISLHTISSIDADSAYLSKEIEIAPSYTPLLVYNGNDEAKEVVLVPADEKEADKVTFAEDFWGTSNGITATPEDLEEYNIYILTEANAFVRILSVGTLSAHRCFLAIPKSEPANARVITFSDEATGIETLQTEGTSADTDAMYDVTGRKLNKKPASGIVIQRGKKLILK